METYEAVRRRRLRCRLLRQLKEPLKTVVLNAVVRQPGQDTHLLPKTLSQDDWETSMTATRRLHVIGVASSAGAYGLGQEIAPAAFRRYGLMSALETAGRQVVDAGVNAQATVGRFAQD